MVWFVLYPNISSMPSSGAGGGVSVPPWAVREVAQFALALALPSFFGLRGFGGNWLREQSGRRTVCGFSFLLAGYCLAAAVPASTVPIGTWRLGPRDAPEHAVSGRGLVRSAGPCAQWLRGASAGSV